MSARPVALFFAFAFTGLVGAGSACTFTSQGAGGAAADLWYPDGAVAPSGDDSGSSAGHPNGGNGDDGAVSSTGSSGGGTGSSGGGTGSSGGGTSSGGPPDDDASSPAEDATTSCPAPTTFFTDCEAYYGDQWNGSAACAQCINGSTCGSAPEAACNVPICEQKCNAQIGCSGSSCPLDRYCTCMATCEQGQGGDGCCAAQADQFYACSDGMCSGPCLAQSADAGIK